jgi:hypothetical protein
MLRQEFIESNNRLDRFSDAIDSLRITSFGTYISSMLANFTYLDRVVADIRAMNEQLANFLAAACNDDLWMLKDGKNLIVY